MKAKSMKLRFLLTMKAFFKYTDENHRLNTVKLNKILRPYGLECTFRVLSDSARILKEYGFDVRSKGEWKHQGFWIHNRPLSDETLKKLVFAVSSNPHITDEETTEILCSLAPFVTYYQEPMLCGGVLETDPSTHDEKLYEKYNIIAEAIHLSRRILYTIEEVRFNKEEQSVYKAKQWETLFTPKCIYQAKNNLYLVGYNHPDHRIEAVPLTKITSVRFAFKHNMPNAPKVYADLADIDPKDYIPEERSSVIYKGPAEFLCRGQYLQELVREFDMPNAAVIKDGRSRTTYSVQEAEIRPETLLWLSNIPGYGIRIKGPEALKEAVEEYYSTTSKTLLSAKLPAYKKCK